MKLKSLFDGARYLGQADGVRKTYSIFETDKNYLVLGPTEDGYYLNLVEKEAPDIIARAFSGERVTCKQVRAKSKRPDVFYSSLAVLNALYVMVALRRARKLKKRQGAAFIFKVK